MDTYIIIGSIVVLLLIIAALLSDIDKKNKKISDLLEHNEFLSQASDAVKIILIDSEGTHRVFNLQEDDE